MEFDASKFVSTAFKRREEDVPVPELRDFFKGLKNEEKPVWRVRGLTGAELGTVNEAQAKNRNKNAIVEALSSEKEASVTDAIRELIGTGDSVPDDVARRIELLVIGSVAPECSHQMAVKLAEVFPVEFYDLTTKITRLTGLGSEPGKPRRSSTGQTSK